MPRPKRILEVLEKARQLHRQLVEALKLLQGHRSSLEALAVLGVEPVDASLAWTTKRTRYGEYRYPVLRLCPPVYDNPVTECRQVYVTRFRGFAETFVEAAQVSRTLHSLARAAKEALELLDSLEELTTRLGDEIEYAKKLAETIMQVKQGDDNGAAG